VKGIKAAKTVGTLALGFLTLVETAYLFGIGKVHGTRRMHRVAALAVSLLAGAVRAVKDYFDTSSVALFWAWGKENPHASGLVRAVGS